MRGGVAGKGRRGGLGGVDAEAGSPDVHYFRHAGSAGVTSGYLQEVAYSWGRHTWETLEASGYQPGPSNVDHMLCFPQIFPQRCQIGKLLFKCLGAAGNGLRFGIYGNKRDLLVYPGDKLAQSNAVNPTAFQSVQVTLNLSVEAGSLLWLVLQYETSSDAVETRGQFSNEMLPLGGLLTSAWTTLDTWATHGVRPFVGWKIPRAYADGLPSQAPTGVGEETILSHNAAGNSYQLPQVGFTLRTP